MPERTWSFGYDDLGATPRADTPFRIAVLGDFSGRESRGLEQPQDIARRRILPVDRDDLEAVMARLGVAVDLTVGGRHRRTVTVSFDEIDRFHPDDLFARIDVFAHLRDVRRRLLDPAQVDAVADEISAWAEPRSAPAVEPEAPPPGTEAPAYTAEDLFAATMTETERRQAANRDAATALVDALVAEIVAPHVEPAPHPRQADYLAAVDAAIAAQMRAVLHDPAFQAVEAAWRGLFRLVRRLETGPDLKLFLVDVTRAELAADLEAAGGAVERTGLYRLLVEPTVEVQGAEPWALLAGHDTFGPTAGDAALLGGLGRLAQAAGAPFIAAAAPGLVGCPGFGTAPDPDDWREPMEVAAAAAWHDLRAAPEAAFLGLALPRVLLRLPYGAATDPVESFTFEEMPRPAHEAYLWGNPALVAACLVGEAFTAQGWALRPGSVNEFGGLPVHVYDDDGDRAAKPCAEILLTERGAARMVEHGLMPLWSVRDDDRVRLFPLRSLSAATDALLGRWPAPR
jgi:type VI secretion system protein ImpC